MKKVIKIKYHSDDCKIERHGNWYDLRSSQNIVIEKGSNALIDLGISMKLPDYIQANIVPRSSTYNKFGIIQANHYGVIDAKDKYNIGYCGNGDRWKFNAIALFRTANISIGDRLCQFELKVVQDAPFWVKFKWLFIDKIEFVAVNDLDSKDRGGHGSTNIIINEQLKTI